MSSRVKLHPAEQYAADVREGRILACKYVRLAVERYYRDLDLAVEKGWYFSRPAAERAIRFIENLPHIKGRWAGQQIRLEPWQQFVVWNIFGFIWAATNRRRFTEAYVDVARKNGKTTLSAGIGLELLLADGEQGAEVYSCATTRDQARECFGAAQQMVRRCSLARYCRLFNSGGGSIVYERSGSVFKPLSSDAQTLDGKNSSGVIIDEFHAHRDSSVYDVMATSTGSREQPLLFIITTAGTNLGSACYAYRSSAIKVLEGIITDDQQFAIIYTQDSRDEVKDPAMRIKSNPSLGVSLSADYLEKQYKRTKSKPEQEANILTKNFNIWVQAADTWISDEVFTQCRTTTAPEELLGKECYGGLDLAAVGDYTALTLEFHEHERTQALSWFWIPEEKYRDRKDAARENANIDSWVQRGYVKVTPGNVTDYDIIRQDIATLAARYRILSIAYDPWNSTQLVSNLVADGLPMSGFTQTLANFAPPTKEFERMLRLGEYEHFDNPVVRWMLSNVIVYRDGNGNLRPDKRRSTEKIDGIVAAIMAHGEWMHAHNGSTGQSVYETRGLLGADDEDEGTDEEWNMND